MEDQPAISLHSKDVKVTKTAPMMSSKTPSKTKDIR